MNPVMKYEDKYPVKLNIYDMTEFNRYSEKLGLGVYHSGIEVFGSEYSFGGHPHTTSGVFTVEPKGAGEHQEQFQFKETVFIGYTKSNVNDLTKLVHSLGSSRFRGRNYHLIYNNCNHFTNDLAMSLCETPIPGWVNRLARISSHIPLLASILPQEVLMPAITMFPDDNYQDNRKHDKNQIV